MSTFIHAYADLSSWLGLVISAVGMLLTIWTLVTARGIKAKLMRRFQLPELIKEIQNGLTELGLLLVEAKPDSHSLKVLIRRVSVTLRNAHNKTKGAEIAKALSRAHELLNREALTKMDGNRFYLEMTGAHQELCLEKKDDEWNI
jgi:translation initiation factor 2B subunit (eIF-2B alpha/beta/delta family)